MSRNLALLLLICATGWFHTLHATQPSRMSTVGVIEIIDAATRSFMLRGDISFVAGPRVKLSTRSVGDEVTVLYEAVDGQFVAFEIRRRPIAQHAPTNASSDR